MVVGLSRASYDGRLAQEQKLTRSPAIRICWWKGMPLHSSLCGPPSPRDSALAITKLGDAVGLRWEEQREAGEIATNRYRRARTRCRPLDLRPPSRLSANQMNSCAATLKRSVETRHGCSLDGKETTVRCGTPAIVSPLSGSGLKLVLGSYFLCMRRAAAAAAAAAGSIPQ